MFEFLLASPPHKFLSRDVFLARNFIGTARSSLVGRILFCLQSLVIQVCSSSYNTFYAVTLPSKDRLRVRGVISG
jgi:hypothetical protein